MDFAVLNKDCHVIFRHVMHESKVSAVGGTAQMQSIRRQHVVWYSTACNFELPDTS